jgi:hypothetical protein
MTSYQAKVMKTLDSVRSATVLAMTGTETVMGDLRS